jgi:Molecular chaperone
LTAEAAEAAGYGRMTLLEEPQAALYSWIQKSGGQWRKQVKVGDIILVVDVGGGTTDLSLIAVIEREGNLELHRVAVGEHILLGGDNMDLALAHVVARKLARRVPRPTRGNCAPSPMRAARRRKRCSATVDGYRAARRAEPRSKLIGGSIRTELTRAELTQTILEGFFPQVDSAARPVSRARAGLTQLGLPYAQDAGITRHLAAFLGRQVGALAELEGLRDIATREGATSCTPLRALQRRRVQVAAAGRADHGHAQWLARRRRRAASTPARRRGSRSRRRARRGLLRLCAARPGRAHSWRHGSRVLHRDRIGDARRPRSRTADAGTVRRPFGMEEGTDAELPAQEFGLVSASRCTSASSARRCAVRIRSARCSTSGAPRNCRNSRKSGDAARPGRTAGEVVPVKLHARVTEAGTLELEAVPRGTDERWKVEFDVRGSANA